MLSITVSRKVQPDHIIGYVFNILRDHYDLALATKYLQEVRKHRDNFDETVRVTRLYIDVVVAP